MFDQIIRQSLERWAGRLRNVRAELVSISTMLEPIVKNQEEVDPNIGGAVKELNKIQDHQRILASSVQGICGILVRVLDAMRGQN